MRFVVALTQCLGKDEVAEGVGKRRLKTVSKEMKVVTCLKRRVWGGGFVDKEEVKLSSQVLN